MSGKNYEAHRLESAIKSDFMKYMQEFYPTAHTVLIPGTYWRLLPYDVYIFENAIFRAVELKIDENPLAAHQYKALFDVVANRGYGFSVRYLNETKKFVVENFTLGTTETFGPEQSLRQKNNESNIGSNEIGSRTKKEQFHRICNYIMSFTVSPIEAEIQKIIKHNYEVILKRVIESAGSRTK